MKHKIHILIALTAIAFLSSCDVSEDGFKPIDGSFLKLNVSANTLQFSAMKGASDEFSISSTVRWIIDCQDPHFSFSQTSGTGDAKITVFADRNLSSNVLKSTFRVISEDVNGLEYTVSMEQNRTLFPSALEPSFYDYPEEGGEQTLDLTSSIDWMFEFEKSAAGFRILPDEKGSGSYNPFDVSLVWGPNYTASPRSVTLAFVPSSYDDRVALDDKLPPSITLTQAAGTLPRNVSLLLGKPSGTECEVALRFESVAPVEECGVILNGGKRVQASLPSPESREVFLTITGLTENKEYTVTPYVISKVGESQGPAQTIRTDGSEPSEDDNDPVKPI